jgi:uncharacterized membrane protein
MAIVKYKVRLNHWRIIYALALSSLVSVGLFLFDAIKGHSFYYWFMLWNLGLALIAPLLAWWLKVRLNKTAWLHVSNLLISWLWLIFLPNSFYLTTDLIHAQAVIGVDLLYNYVFILSCIFNGLIAGYLSIYFIHSELVRRLYYRWAHLIVACVLLLCSFAIYMGRYLRWSSWDIVSNPAGVLFDFSDTVTSPSSHPEVVVTTLIYFALLGSLYVVIWQFIQQLRKPD